MSFEIEYTSEALEDIEKLKKTGNKSLMKKLYVLIQELKETRRLGRVNLKNSNILNWEHGPEG